MAKNLFIAALIIGLHGLCQEVWSDDHIQCLLHCRKSPNLVAPEISVHLKLQPLTLFERKFPGQSTTLGRAISGYDAYSLGLSHLQRREKLRFVSAEPDGAIVSNTFDRVLINNLTPSCVILIRGSEGYVFPTAFLSSPTVQLMKIQDEDIIATIFMQRSTVTSSDNDSLRELALCEVGKESDGDVSSVVSAGGEESTRSGQELRFITSGLLSKAEWQQKPPEQIALLIDPEFPASEWFKTTFETIRAANGGPLSGRPIVWVLHRNKPFRGIKVHYIVPVKGIGTWGVDGAAFKSLLTQVVAPDEKWNGWQNNIAPTGLMIQDGDHLELTDLELVGPFGQISVR